MFPRAVLSRIRLSTSLTKSSVAEISSNDCSRLSSRDSLFASHHDTLKAIASVPVRHAGRYEPTYLDEITHEPRYEAVQLRFKGYDFPILERYSLLCKDYADKFGIKVDQCYPIPTQQTKISHFDPKENGKEGANVIEEFVLNIFERVVNLKEVDAKALPLFIQFLRNHQPEGVELSAGLPDPELEKFRFIPDMEMTVLQRKLADLDSGKVDSLTWKKDV